MKKLISLILSLSFPAFAQLIDVQDPSGKGLVKAIPYTSTWSQKWLTNTSVSSAAAQLAPFFNTNSTFGNINVTTITDPYGVYTSSTNIVLKNATNFGSYLLNGSFSNIVCIKGTFGTLYDVYGAYPVSTNVQLKNAAIVYDQYGALPSSTNIQTKSTLLTAIYPYVVVNVDDVATNSGLSVNSVNTGYGTYVVMSNTAPDTTSTVLAGSGIYVSSNVVGSVTSYSVSNTIPQTILSQSTGITISSNFVNGAAVFTVSASGTNQVSVTNLNAQTLSGYGALTTNATYTTFQQLTNLGIVLTNTWQYYCDAANAYTNAKAYTNGLISSSTVSSTYLTIANASSTYLSQANAALNYQSKGNYQPLGTYLTPSSSLDYNNVTNKPAPYTNFSTAFVGTLYATNETATTLEAATANVATGNITNANITTASVTTGYVTNANVTTANVTTANIATANITNANVTTANVTTGNITNANVTTLVATNARIGTANVSSNLTAYNVTVTNAVTLPAFQASAGTTNAFCVDSNGNAIAVSFDNMRTFMQQTNYVFDSTNLVSGDMAIANFSHGFSATPSYVKWVLVCTTTNASYSVGDEADFTAFQQSGPNRTLTYGYNSTKIWALKSGNFSMVLSKINGNGINNGTAPASLDQTLWKARCYYRP